MIKIGSFILGIVFIAILVLAVIPNHRVTKSTESDTTVIVPPDYDTVSVDSMVCPD